MNTRLIRDEAELATALKRLEEIWAAPVGSLEGEELETLAILVERFEAEHCELPVMLTASDAYPRPLI